MKGWWLLAASCLLSACVPWTIRPIDQSAERSDRPFDAGAYVDSIWQSKVLPAVSSQALDLASSPRCSRPCLVKGLGRVLRVDTGSRAGLAFVELAPYGGRPGAVLQIGPVIRGTVLRDALPFIQFGQFVNQLEFARVGNALNDRVVKTVLAGIEPRKLTGAEVTFSGAAEGSSGDQPPEIVPVTLSFRRGNP